MGKFTIRKHGKVYNIETDYSNAYVVWEGKKILKKDYPNIFEALSMPIKTSHHFDFRIIPIQGVKSKTTLQQTLIK